MIELTNFLLPQLEERDILVMSYTWHVSYLSRVILDTCHTCHVPYLSRAILDTCHTCYVPYLARAILLSALLLPQLDECVHEMLLQLLVGEIDAELREAVLGKEQAR